MHKVDYNSWQHAVWWLLGQKKQEADLADMHAVVSAGESIF